MTIKQSGGIFGRNPSFNTLDATTLTASGNITSSAGNIVIGTSGKGIDFSATSGTGTSELFSDYEEGSWSPVLNAYEGTPTISGYYVKIGQMVHLECSIELDGTVDGSGYIITNLPFSAASPYFGGGTLVQNDGGVTDLLVRMNSSSHLRIHNSSNVIQSYFAVGASSTIVINAQYRAA